MKSVLAIVGPTATGKSELAVYLAQRLGGEVVNADSRQVYCRMDIGTAKPGREQMKLVRHHLIDVVEPDEEFSLATYQDLAYHAIRDIRRRGKLPIIAGGTGLYVWSVVEGWRIPHVPSEKGLRDSLEEKARTGPADILYNELSKVDPESARAIAPSNTRRIIRALEVFYITGTPLSVLKTKAPPDFETAILGLTMKREGLYRRIDERVDRMITSGLVEETKSLVEMGYSQVLPSMSGIGYREIVSVLKGELELNAAVVKIKNATHNFARRQYAWFHLIDSRIRWFDVGATAYSEILEYVRGCLTLNDRNKAFSG